METREPTELYPKQKKPSTNGHIPGEKEENRHILTKRELEEFGIYVSIPGAFGGLTKVLLELENSRWLAEPIEAQSPSQSHYPSCSFWYCSVPINIFLGAISALIGVFVLAGLFDVKKNKFTIIASALFFGMAFPAAFETVLQNQQLQEDVKQEAFKVENVRTETIEEIKYLAVNTEDPNVQEEVIEDIENFAVITTSPNLKEEAIENTGEIAAITEDNNVKVNAVQSLKNIALQAKEDGVKKKAINTIEQIKSEDDSEKLQNLLEESISKIEQDLGKK